MKSYYGGSPSEEEDNDDIIMVMFPSPAFLVHALMAGCFQDVSDIRPPSPKKRNTFEDFLDESWGEETGADNPDDDELKRYLSTPVEKVENPLLWWLERRAAFPILSRMAAEYLSAHGVCCLLPFSMHYLIFFYSFICGC